MTNSDPIELLREIEQMIRVEPGDLDSLPMHVAEYIRRSQELLCAVARERDQWKSTAHGVAF